MEIENKYNEIAHKIFADNIYCTIATATPGGEPWISPMYFQYDDDYNIYWISAKDCKHSKLIEQNPRVAITIFDSLAQEGTGNAVYIVARASEAEREELPHALSICV